MYMYIRDTVVNIIKECIAPYGFMLIIQEKRSGNGMPSHQASACSYIYIYMYMYIRDTVVNIIKECIAPYGFMLIIQEKRSGNGMPSLLLDGNNKGFDLTTVKTTKSRICYFTLTQAVEQLEVRDLVWHSLLQMFWGKV